MSSAAFRRACHSCIDNVCHLEIVCENLHAHGGVDLADTAADNDSLSSIKGAFKKLHSCLFADI